MIVSGPRVVDWVAKRLKATYNMPQGIGLEKRGEIVAGVVFDEFNGANINIAVASDGSRRWLNRKFLWAVFDYAFIVCGAKRITALIAESNADSQRFCTHIGFTYEATLEDAHIDGDILIFRLFRRDCRWR